MTEDIQRFFNTKIKFVHQKVSFRIGRRCEGTTTTETINKTEYLRVGHDYLLIDISKGMSDKFKKEYFAEMAAKRLDDVKFGCIDIRNMFGAIENLDEECLELCKGRDKHLRVILSENASIRKDPKLCDKIISIIKYPQNPIMETLNALWVIRRKGSPEKAAEIVRSAMLDYLEKQDSKDAVCVAPLSTKPVALGICLFALDHDFIRIVYPVSSEYKTDNTLNTYKTNIYTIEL